MAVAVEVATLGVLAVAVFGFLIEGWANARSLGARIDALTKEMGEMRASFARQMGEVKASIGALTGEMRFISTRVEHLEHHPA